MKIVLSIRIFAFVFIFGLLSCGEEKTKENKNVNTETNKNPEKKSEEPKNNITTQKVGFEKMLEALFETDIAGSKNPKILKKDIVNGYVAFEVVVQDTKLKYNGQVGYFISNNGGEFLAVALPSCMQSCNYSLMFFQMEAGKLALKPTEDFVEGMSEMNAFGNAMLEQMQAKMTDDEKEAQKQGNMGLYDEIITIPQQGTTITFEKISNITENANKILVTELQYNVATGTFNLITK